MSYHTVRAVAIALCTLAVVAADYQLRKFTFTIVLVFSYFIWFIFLFSFFLFVCLFVCECFGVTTMDFCGRVKLEKVEDISVFSINFFYWNSKLDF